MQRTVYHALFFKMRRFYRVVVDGTSPIATVRWDPRGQSGGRWLSYAEFCHLIDAHRVEQASRQRHPDRLAPVGVVIIADSGAPYCRGNADISWGR
jgi:hypothetical protein